MDDSSKAEDSTQTYEFSFRGYVVLFGGCVHTVSNAVGAVHTGTKVRYPELPKLHYIVLFSVGGWKITVPIR